MCAAPRTGNWVTLGRYDSFMGDPFQMSQPFLPGDLVIAASFVLARGEPCFV